MSTLIDIFFFLHILHIEFYRFNIFLIFELDQIKKKVDYVFSAICHAYCEVGYLD